MTRQYHLGKHPATPRKTDLRLAKYLDTTTLPTIPSSFGFDHVLPPDAWGMLGNDRYGDCVWASAAHETEVLTARGAGAATFTEQGVLSDYSAATGFDPRDPNTDQGTNMHDAMSYRQHTGIIDAAGHRHRVGAYLSVDPGNMTELWQALYIFEAVAIGIEFPSSAMQQFNARQPWSVVKGSRVRG